MAASSVVADTGPFAWDELKRTYRAAKGTLREGSGVAETVLRDMRGSKARNIAIGWCGRDLRRAQRDTPIAVSLLTQRRLREHDQIFAQA